MTPILIIVIIFALGFEFLNGFNDTANAIATSVYTRALTVGKAIALAAVMNFIGALVSESVADTIVSGIITVNITEHVVLAALIGAIVWDLFAWWRGIPCSSSHALIGGLIGATIVYTFTLGDIKWASILEKVIIPLFTSPLIGFFAGLLVMKLLYKLLVNFSRHKVNHVFSRLQVVSAALVAFTHGTNDAQKTMGIITLSLITAGIIPVGSHVPLAVKVACALAIAIGTSVGGRRIMKTVGGGMTRLEPAGGFVAQTASAAVIAVMTAIGAPISTTQVVSTSVMGVGSARRLRSVKWQTAGNMVLTWVTTLPCAAALGAVFSLVFGLVLSCWRAAKD
jgi:PiT family inorganic phosphate transporter